MYSFDPVGSYEREACRAAGAAQSLVQPFLDNQVRLMSIQTMNEPDMYTNCSVPTSAVNHAKSEPLPISCRVQFLSHFSLVYSDVIDLVKPFLFFVLQIYFKNQTPAPGASFPKHLPLFTVLSLVIDSFTGATERHIEVCFFFLPSFFSSFFSAVRLQLPLSTFRCFCLSFFVILPCPLNIQAHGISLIRLETV